ncbi:M15 family metallopeptidase [Cellulomonas fengjieae]|uniref:M15 family metallopeptidase n=1 Tax=Cellulomonas fengjieae TaxID=2819978 RepID=A0ABS3SC99_9CELL|nr:M15 family metallopeptidase [Cellulomonas fengjieae]MBO3083380.1 M15 family metallopeptidase [Cellulomonas fengjieae]QVI67991.1 M15 family metallopeptidase [Cellulomonas fengjieae]
MRGGGLIGVAVLVLAGCAAPDVPRSSPSPTPVQVSAPAEVAPEPADAPVVASAPAFTSAISEITPELAARMEPSWRPGCPVPLEDLRYVSVTHRGFDGLDRQGELVVHADAAQDMVTVFRALFDAGYPVRSMRLVDDFDASDDDSMAADNTSAFNCRAITGGSEWSEHAYGRAIDLNPVENPYVRGSSVAPPGGREFAGRPDLPGVIHADDEVVRAFASVGWLWGGDWESPIDYQHFSASGR